MNPEKKSLVQELLDDSARAARREATLTAGRRVLRHRRQRRVVLAFGLGLGCVLVALSAFRQLFVPPQPAARVRVTSSPALPPPPVAPFRVHQLTDDELLKLFPDVPVGLATVQGKKYLVFPRPADRQRFVLSL